MASECVLSANLAFMVNVRVCYDNAIKNFSIFSRGLIDMTIEKADSDITIGVVHM